MTTLLQDVRYACRTLRKSPGFTAVALVTLALGIGANTAVFSVVDALLVRALPVPNPQRLALLAQPRPGGEPDLEFNYPLFKDYQRQNEVFTELCATAEAVVGFGTGGATERRDALLVSGNYFRMLGVDAAVGRAFAPDEGAEIDDAAVVVLGHGLWQTGFGADPGVVGRAVTVNGRPFTVVGVAPREFAGTTRGSAPDLYVPITAYGQLNTERPGGDHPLATRFFTWHRIMGRLKEGVSHGQAEASMNLLTKQVAAVTRANTPENLAVLPGARGFTQDLRDARLPLNLLLATSGLVLLIACANLANLQLARATGRSRDFAIRLALGARRGRLVRELLTESLLLSVGGGVLGVLVAVWLSGALQKVFPADASGALADGGVDLRVLAFTLLVSVATGAAFGLAPAWRASRPRVVPELKSGGGTTESRVGTWNLRGALVTFQVALSLLVLVGAGLCVRSLRKLQAVDPGFEPSRVVVMSFDLGLNHYTVPGAAAFYDRLLERVRALPGVEAASLTNRSPLGGGTGSISIERLDGYQKPPGEVPVARMNVVSADYFRTLGVRFLGGRDFRPSDTSAAPRVMIVNEAFVRRFWGSQDPLGRMVYLPGPGGATPIEVVGVARSMRSQRLSEPPSPTMFFCGAQGFPTSQHYLQGKTLAVRTGLDPSATIGVLRELVRSFDANVPVFNVRTLARQKDQSLSLQRTAAALLGSFGVLALLLAALGIYGVLAYAVRRRTREIGIRMALGAQVADVLRLVLRQGLALTVAGLAVGLAGAVAATRLLRGFLYDVKPLDPLTFAAVVVLLAGTALLACWLPARRAARVDPMVAVRYE